MRILLFLLMCNMAHADDFMDQQRYESALRIGELSHQLDERKAHREQINRDDEIIYEQRQFETQLQQQQAEQYRAIIRQYGDKN